MIIEKHPLPDDPTPADAPPSYDALSDTPSATGQTRDYKHGLIDHPGPSGLRSPLLSPSPPLPLKSPTPSTSSSKGKARATNWFNFSSAEARTAREVRNTVLGLVRDLIQEHITNSPATAGILQSCAEACSSHSLSLSSILQEKSIENHTPLYWAIVKRPPDEHQEQEVAQCPDLLTALISYATPLNRETITEVRLACLATSDQALFQRLRLSPEFAPVSGIDQMLLGGTIPPEEVVLEDMAGEGGGAFAVNFVIPHFHKRMVVSKEIALEFIARSRMWRLSFFIAPEPRVSGMDPPAGSWCVALSLVEASPPTAIDSRLLIAEAKPTKLPEASGSGESSSPPRTPFRLPSKSKPAPSIRLRSTQPLEAARRGYRGKSVVVSLEDSVGANLQYGNNPYIGPDEKLRVRLEARLGKPDAECIIC
ncbi:hypothetical protein GALMADRAFT_80192 [Galerina marginata CBS 339.88]|uniref:Uncharacterized protein n=1 Tax=Galerina marginata (strain CBS 339.88) TaxID=685588 RepID=A0A067SKA9_GALM3|nr:hypothetical protein GALMADRAFT_80192 [Galerina marginata CBS 339.88]